MANATRSEIAHLYRRAGFGASPSQIDQATQRPYEDAVEALVSAAGDPSADAAVEPDLAITANGTDLESIEERRARQKLRRSQRSAIATWWLQRMTLSEQPLAEKMTLFWHAHFATSLDKVNEAAFMVRQNKTFRAGALGAFEPLVQAIAKDPAMMIWLDANQNRKGSPNENFARELMELFTIGIGSYSDADVREAARAFTGWRVNHRTGVFSVQANMADTQPKKVLGTTLSTGEDAVRLLATSPAAARFVSWKLWCRFAAPVDIAAAPVNDLAASFQSSGGDLRAVMRTLLLHPRFRSVETRQGLVKQPIELVVGALRACGLHPTDLEITGPSLLPALAALNQVPFEPPSVGGWPQNDYWISTATALRRLSFFQQLAARANLDWLNAIAPAQRSAALAARLGVDAWSKATATALASTTNTRQLLALALASPEHVLN